MKKADNFDASKWLVENKITTQSRLNENKIPGVDVDNDGEQITLSGDSGDYDGFIEDDGTVSFSVTNDEEDFNDQNWKSILGKNHVFVKVANAIPTKVEALGDYVMITVKASDLTSMNESKLNEDLASKIAALPDFNTAMDSEKSELVVGKYVVVRYDDREYEDGQDMYVVWDNTRDQDEIGSYDDVPEFESIYPNEVANWLKQNESLNEVERERFLTDEQKADIVEFMNYGIGALQQLKQDRMAFGKKMFEKYGTDSYKSIFSSMFSGLTSMIADTKRNISGIKGGNHDYK